jgi:hypothetical protein
MGSMMRPCWNRTREMLKQVQHDLEDNKKGVILSSVEVYAWAFAPICAHLRSFATSA